MKKNKLKVKIAPVVAGGKPFPPYTHNDVCAPSNLAGVTWINQLEMAFNSTTVLKIQNYNHYANIHFLTSVAENADKTFLEDSGCERDERGNTFKNIQISKFNL